MIKIVILNQNLKICLANFEKQKIKNSKIQNLEIARLLFIKI